ncbi:peptidoglycan recognition protein family protein [Marinitenerispora sediminis]|uniref:N-acetylmuramoyl-L-alanine amidase n=1 Tax=Marinitenerispora sediminis TaxID=1931232 RepID=A0A368T928_9ACTN|nr:peptidoglycan recognition family protein [Marinitenerispora sediminis]RCV55435.1 N-acetylmuramoyl-L-alanine amidase [Marinitenerispora sediminis]RCV60781.1 N-acetylmuramoyl-L-alanine amidase [Marinitenerispora sediminis]RCV61732.1 N-acetylmuramoyl-L-alanine amidase [Marinitenerispora sediminis]
MSTHEQPAAPGGCSRRSVVRGAMAVAGGVILGGAIDLGLAASVHAAPEFPVFNRRDWGARAYRRRAKVLDNGPTHIVVHHTATTNSTDYSVEHAFALSRSIQRYHMTANRWDDTGQHLTISRGGVVMEGRNGTLPAIRRGRHVVGAHTANHNSHTIGIENEGTYTTALPTTELLNALVETCAWLCVAYGLNPSLAIVGHRDYNATVCPGDELYAMLPQLRTDVGARLARLETRLAQLGPAEIPAADWPAYPEVPVGERRAPYYHGPVLSRAERTV